jgi:isocitrate dehydrogenase kinase/phosphatase
VSDSTEERGFAEAAARGVHDAFERYLDEFRDITRGARARFEARDWRGCQEDARRRLDLYGRRLHEVVAFLQERLGERVRAPELWAAMKRSYEARVAGRSNAELARTFFNSATRRILDTVGVNPDVEFVAPHEPPPEWSAPPSLFRPYEPRGDLRGAMLEILRDHAVGAAYRDVEEDAALAARALENQVGGDSGGGGVDLIETLTPLFFRNKGAYIMGRVRTDGRWVPLVLPLLHTERGVELDAALTAENDVSIVFSFTRSHFLVDTDSPDDLVGFLRTVLPLKPVSELYTALGFDRHGKTALYRELQSHMLRTSDLFETAAGDAGMVMLVFTLPSYDLVFKVIRDRFAYPKTNTRRDVLSRYRLVFRHDRVGRLVDAQEFEHLTFRRERFDTALLEELARDASKTVQVRGDEAQIKHLYTERKLTPLNLFVRRAAERPACEAVIDYGRAIKELAAADIFPGDFLLKNFGVTRHGRVVFYDYDELCRLRDCRFRRFPPARTPEDELSDEPWFSVRENDVFPEEFRRFLGLPAPLARCFVEHHADLFDADFWRGLQARHAAGEILDVFPYSADRRLRPPTG